MGFDVTCEMRPDTTIVWKRTNFDVAHKPWQNHREMVNAKPVQDSLRLDLEFLNRSVQIIIEEGDCWTKSVDKTDQINQ